MDMNREVVKHVRAAVEKLSMTFDELTAAEDLLPEEVMIDVEDIEDLALDLTSPYEIWNKYTDEQIWDHLEDKGVFNGVSEDLEELLYEWCD